MQHAYYTILVRPDHESSGYYATVSALPGVAGQSEIVEEALENVRAALAWASGVDYLVSGDGRHLLGLALSDYPPAASQGNFWLSSKSATPVRAKAKR